MNRVSKESYPKYTHVNHSRYREIEKMIVDIATKNPIEDYGTLLNLVFKDSCRMDTYPRR